MNSSLAYVVILGSNFHLAEKFSKFFINVLLYFNAVQYYAVDVESIYELQNSIGLLMIFLIKLSKSSGMAVCLWAR